MENEQFMEDLLSVLPHWHWAVERTLKQSLSGKMSLETYYCLQTLRHHGPMTMSDLALRLHISRQQATQMVARLWEADMVRRLHENPDRRTIEIEITEHAKDYIQRTLYQNTAFLQALTDRVGEENMAELAAAVSTLLRILPQTEE